MIRFINFITLVVSFVLFLTALFLNPAGLFGLFGILFVFLFFRWIFVKKENRREVWGPETVVGALIQAVIFIGSLSLVVAAAQP